MALNMATEVETATPRTNPYSMGTQAQSALSQKKTWLSRHYFSGRRSQQPQPGQETGSLSRQTSQRSRASSRGQTKWWQIRLFRGMIDDLKRRTPYYWSDWTDAWDYRVVPATIYMYFAKYDLWAGSLFMLRFSFLVCTSLTFHIFFHSFNKSTRPRQHCRSSPP